MKFVRSGFEIVARLNILAPRDLPPASYGAYPQDNLSTTLHGLEQEERSY